MFRKFMLGLGLVIGVFQAANAAGWTPPLHIVQVEYSAMVPTDRCLIFTVGDNLYTGYNFKYHLNTAGTSLDELKILMTALLTAQSTQSTVSVYGDGVSSTEHSFVAVKVVSNYPSPE